ncbi:MAG: fatty acid desaturase [Deltaproteobacteria bacterium]|nr:fatty acid desaturase [Deltaproteobacteria bacterium]
MRGALDALATTSAIVIVIGVAHAAANPVVYLVAAALIGGLQHSLVNLSHEGWHRLCFTNRRLNDWVGAWIYSYPLGVPFHHDRERHLQHHRLVGAPSDPDWVNYSNEGRLPAGRLRLYLAGRLLGSQLVATVWSALFSRQPRIAVEAESAAADSAAPTAGSEMIRIVAVQALLFVTFALFGRWWEYIALWLGPLATFASFYVAVRAFVEHAALRDDVAPVERLHDFAPGLVERFFLSPCHFYFHALHHAFPTVPHFRLAALQSALDAAGHVYPGTRQGGGYVARLREHLASIDAALPSGASNARVNS